MNLRQHLRDIISLGFSGTQKDLCQAIIERGLEVNQSSVSRALKNLGALKNNGKWVIPSGTPQGSAMMAIADHIVTTVHNESMMIVKTLPGSAHYVGGYIDRRQDPIILGTVAGDDTILVIPATTKAIEKTHQELCDLLGV